MCEEKALAAGGVGAPRWPLEDNTPARLVRKATKSGCREFRLSQLGHEQDRVADRTGSGHLPVLGR